MTSQQPLEEKVIVECLECPRATDLLTGEWVDKKECYGYDWHMRAGKIQFGYCIEHQYRNRELMENSL